MQPGLPMNELRGRAFPAGNMIRAEGLSARCLKEPLSHGTPYRPCSHRVLERWPVASEYPDNIVVSAITRTQPLAISIGIARIEYLRSNAPPLGYFVAPGRQQAHDQAPLSSHVDHLID